MSLWEPHLAYSLAKSISGLNETCLKWAGEIIDHYLKFKKAQFLIKAGNRVVDLKPDICEICRGGYTDKL